MLSWFVQSLIKRRCSSCLNMRYLKFRGFCTRSSESINPSVKTLNRWKILFYGTDDISLVTLQALNSNRLSSNAGRVVESLDVVCNKTDCPVKKYAEASNLTINYWPYTVAEGKYDVGIVVSFGHLIPTKSILACKFGMINAHPSLLPRWRGAAPIIHSILHGDKETGVTIITVAPKKFDVGNILAQQKYSIPENFNSIQLSNILAKLAAEMVLKTLEDLPHALEASRPQPAINVTLAPKVKPDMGNVQWEQSSVSDIDKRFRAYNGFINIFTHFKKMKLLLLDFLSPQEAVERKIQTFVSENVRPGYIYFHKRRKSIYVKCQDGWIGVTKVSIPARGEISAADFYNGFMTKVHKSDCYFTSEPRD